MVDNVLAATASQSHLPLESLGVRHVGLGEVVGAYYTQAARVCLDRHHLSPVQFTIRNAEEINLTVDCMWEPTDRVIKDQWANQTDTTEAGAYACVLAGLELAYGWVAIKRMEILTGADYYVAPPGTSVEDPESCYRLEVSGLDSGSVESLLKRKLEQAAAGKSNLPAIAGVMGFRPKLILFQRLQDDLD